MFPGLGIAIVSFTAYVVYDDYFKAKPVHGHDDHGHGHCECKSVDALLTFRKDSLVYVVKWIKSRIAASSILLQVADRENID